MSDPLELDQDDFVARLLSWSPLADVPVLEQRRGFTESDVMETLGTLNVRTDKRGAFALVLMPTLEPLTPDAPGPEYRVRQTVQIFEHPDMNRAAGGTGLTAEQIAGHTRQLFHHFHGGRGAWTFAGMEPAPQETGTTVSYLIDFTRLARDDDYSTSATPLIEPASGAAPQSATITAGSGASIYYTTDGSYPYAANTEATLYTAAIDIDSAATLRAVAYESGKLPSRAAQATYT